MAVKFANNVSTTLSAAINATQTTIGVADASGLPSLSSGDYIYLTIDTDAASPTLEVVKVTAISSNSLTVVRGQDGTTASSFSAGVKVELRVTAAALDDIASQAQTAADTESVSISGDSMTGKLTISNANYANHLELVRGSDTLYLSPSGGQLLTNGGLSPAVTNQDALGRTDKYWQDLWLGTSLKMGGTTVINASRNLINIGTISSGAITSSGLLTLNDNYAMINAGTTSNTALEPVIWARSQIGASVVQMNVKGDQWQFGGGGTLDASPTMTIDYGSNAVGIGISSPNAPLEVSGAATTSTDIAHFSNSNGVQKVVIGIDGQGDGQITLIDAGNNTDVLFTAGGVSYINTGGNFGIGTDDPKALTHIYTESGINTADTLLKLTNVANTARYVGFQAQRDNASGQGLNVLITKTDASVVTALTIDTSANVGIAETDPKGLLHVDGFDYSYFSSNVGTATLDNEQGLAVGWNKSSGGGETVLIANQGAGSSGGMAFATNTSTGSYNERMRIDSSGNVGIGEFNPAEKLEVAGNILLNASNAEVNLRSGVAGTSGAINWTFNTDGTNYASIKLPYNDRNTTGLHIDSGYPITLDASGIGTIFAQSGNEKARIDAGGSLLIGQTLGAVYNQSSVTGLKLDGPNGNLQIARSSNPTLLLNRYGNDGDLALFFKNGSGVGSIGTYAGDLTIGDDDVGIRFDTGTGLVPWDLGANTTGGAATNGAIDIGAASARFKDLHLSGTAIANSGFQVGTTGIGNIGNSANDLVIYSSTTGHNGLRFHSNGILPTNNSGAIIDADADLGISNYRFKDLYLSGTISSGAIASTGTSTFGGVQIGGTTVISSSRNLTNIGTISSGAITADSATFGSAAASANVALQVSPATGNNQSGLKVTNTDGGAHTWLGYYDGNNYITGDADVANGGITYIRSESGGAYPNIAKFSPTSIIFYEPITSGAITSSHSQTGGFKITATDSTANAGFSAMTLDYNLSGTDACTADRNHIGIHLDIDSSASGGLTNHEHRIYGIFGDVRASGDSDLVWGAQFNARADDFGVGNQITQMGGVYGQSNAHNGNGIVGTNYGSYGYALNNSSGSGQVSNTRGATNLAYAASTSTYNGAIYIGSHNMAQVSAAQTADISYVAGVWGEIQFDNDAAADHDVTVGSAFVFRAEYDENDSDDSYTVNTGYLYYGNYAGTQPTTAYGVYIADGVRNYFGGSLTAGLGSTTTASYGFNGDINTGMYAPANHEVGFLANGTQRLKVSGTGIDVTGAITSSGNLTAGGIINNTRGNSSVAPPNTADHTAGTRISFYDASATSWYAMGIESSTLWFNSDANYKWYQDGTLRMSLLGDDLAVTGDISVGNSTGGNQFFKRPSANYIFADQTGGYLVFGTNGLSTSLANASLRLDTSKNAIFGGTITSGAITSSGQVTSTRFADAANSSAYFVQPSAISFIHELRVDDFIRHNGDTDTHIKFLTDRVQLTAGNVLMLDCVEGGTDYIDIINRVRVTAGGDLECEGNITAYSTTSISDINQKENIQQISDPIEKVKQISGYTFDWKNSGEHSGGVIAQEVEQIMPDVVKEVSIRDGDEMKSVDYQAIIGLLVETVKDLNKRIEDLENGNN